MSEIGSFLVFSALGIGGMFLYMLPTVIAAKRRHKNDNSILITNFFFGWTGIGYFLCLAWAFSDNTKV